MTLSGEGFVISNAAHVVPWYDISLSSVRREFQLSFLHSFLKKYIQFFKVLVLSFQCILKKS